MPHSQPLALNPRLSTLGAKQRSSGVRGTAGQSGSERADGSECAHWLPGGAHSGASSSQGHGGQELRGRVEAGEESWEGEVGFLSGEEEAWMGSEDGADADLLNLVSVFLWCMQHVFARVSCMRTRYV